MAFQGECYVLVVPKLQALYLDNLIGFEGPTTLFSTKNSLTMAKEIQSFGHLEDKSFSKKTKSMIKSLKFRLFTS